MFGATAFYECWRQYMYKQQKWTAYIKNRPT